MPFIGRKLEFFSFHGRSPKRKFDYDIFFNEVSKIAPQNRVFKIGKRTFAIPSFQYKQGIGSLIIYEGDDKTPLIFNAESGEERHEKLQRNEFVAEKTHAVFDLKKRQFLIEYVQRGAKAYHLSDLLQFLARKIFDDPDIMFTLNPDISEDFIKEVGRFERIRVATMRLSRPNQDWTDCYNGLSEVAEDSEAQDFDVSMKAGRGQSLKKKEGIIKIIGDLVKQPISALKNAKITGTRRDENKETTISTFKHIAHRRTRIRTDEDGYVLANDIIEKMKTFIGL